MRVVARAFRRAKIGFGRAENIGKGDHANVILGDDEARAGSPQLFVRGFDHLLDEREYPFLPLSQRSALQAGKLASWSRVCRSASATFSTRCFSATARFLAAASRRWNSSVIAAIAPFRSARQTRRRPKAERLRLRRQKKSG